MFSGLRIRVMSLPPPPKIFKADQPFVFALLARSQDGLNVLFEGRVLSPQH